MKKFFLIPACLTTLLLVSCSEKAKFEFLPGYAHEAVSVYSDNNDANFFEVVPETYTMTSNKDTLQVELMFKVNDETEMHEYDRFESFLFVPRDKNENKLGEKIQFAAFAGSQMTSQLYGAPEGTLVKVLFQYVPVSKDEKKMILANVSYGDIELWLKDNEFEKEDDEEDDDEVDYDEIDYDEIMDKYVEAAVYGDEETIMAISENMAEAQMEGMLTPEQEKRWLNIDANEVEGRLMSRH